MLKKYCSKCGSPTEYSLIKPKFCSKCGNSLDLNNIKNIVQSTVLNKIEIEDDFSEENDEINNVPDIKSLQFENISSSEIRGEKLMDIIRNQNGEKTSRRTKGKRVKISAQEAKKLAQEVLNEGKTLRNKNKK